MNYHLKQKQGSLMTWATFMKIFKTILAPACFVLNLLYFPLIKRFFFSKINLACHSKQIFFMNRVDFGTWLVFMHYAECWHQERGAACIMVFIPNPLTIIQLSKMICPNVEVIVFNNILSRFIIFIFGRSLIYAHTMNRIYAYSG